MTELELFDKLNPKRDLPQATCDVISQVYKVMNIENEQLKAQIEKMKSCGNCRWCSNQCCIESFENPISHRGCENYSQWELAE